MKIKNTPLIFLMVFIASCKKDKAEPEPPRPQIALVKQTVINGNPYNLFAEYVYDSQKRLQEIKESGINNNLVNRRYSYSPTLVQFRYYINGAETPSASVNYTLNGSGYVQEASLPSGNQRTVYEYNEAGYIKKENYYTNGIAVGYGLYSYSNNNMLDSISVFTNNGNKSNVRIFSYETGKRNTTGNENKGLLIFGKDQLLPLKNETFVAYNIPGYAGVRLKFFEHSYENGYDDRGRTKSTVLTRTDYSYPGGISGSYISAAYEYTYQ